MQIDPAALSAPERYQLMIQCLVPRPIAWVSTVSPAGAANLAPFSFFGGVTAAPFTVMVSVGRRRSGAHKDTARNLLDTGEAVIHIPHRPLAEAMVKSSAEVDPGVDEFALTGLAKTPSVRVAPPRVASAAIAMEARRVQHFEVGTAPVDLFLLEVLLVHVADEFYQAGNIDPARLNAVGRLGGSSYCNTTAVFDVPRP
ncbi:MAG: flavin reductase family protein [Planctomycetota bacterium]